jgi:outer membrane protein assembly factor BamE (lipoprotein component of BamABCDE complex)
MILTRDAPFMRKTHASLLLIAGLAGLSLAGCSPITAVRGNLVEDSRLSQIQTGTTTRDQVQYVLGSPTSTGTVDGTTWYYIGRHTAQEAFFDPEVTAQRILRIRFDEQGTVQEIKEIDGSDAAYVEPVARVTPTEGHDMGFFEQLMSNLSKPARKKKDDDKKK